MKQNDYDTIFASSSQFKSAIKIIRISGKNAKKISTIFNFKRPKPRTFVLRKLIYKDKKAVLLTEKESDIFVSLLNSEDRGITKEEVMSKVWMLNPNIETHTFETHLYRLRKNIKETLILNDFIINKEGRFYLNHEHKGKKN